MEQSVETFKQYIIFKIEDQFYGTDIKNIQMIERMKPIMRVPKAPSSIKGIMNLRGEIITVIDLRRLFDLKVQLPTDKTRIIIVKMEEATVGLIVDEVKEVINIQMEQIELLQDIQGKTKSSYIEGIGKINQEIVTLLNLAQIINEAFLKEQRK